ncbi:hypothetical protein [Phytohabitans houttuyneae]|jgi:hypothetical protein|uniref:Lipoprotein n=1 Tax=Phytohabitans houttuyneae TaxID=1076126 RepID=A0A6V8KQG9_9ACTN|nr:hypothetical protein [Phytohabitans houttuyneae]GFJ82855.1 hypothetical protein Phou_070350 [Phytohabitans houttuyneae]
MTRALRLGAALALALAATAACGGTAEAPPVATAGGSSTSASPGGDAVAAYVENQRNLVKCFREQGFDVPDPDAQGRIDLGPAMGGRKKTDPKVRAAWEACKEFSVPVPAELQEKPEPVTAEQLANRREYAKCMRANGMPRWPDPRPDGSWPEDMLGGELTPQEQAANIAALQICDPVLDGRPPTTPNPNDVPKG